MDKGKFIFHNGGARRIVGANPLSLGSMLRMGLLVFLSGRARAEVVVPADGSAAAQTAVAVSSSAPVVPEYVFRGDRYRDPFIPLVGSLSGMDLRRPTAEPIGPFNPTNAEVKGIIRSPSGRWAVIRTGEGVAYVVRDGKVMDPKRKPVDGYHAIIREKTVVIIDPKNQEFELRLKKGDGQKK